MSAWHDARRARMVAGLLAPRCDHCDAAPGAWCDPMARPPVEMCRVDRYPPRVVCSARMAAAVAGRHVNRRVLVAQFAGGKLAEGLEAA